MKRRRKRQRKGTKYSVGSKVNVGGDNSKDENDRGRPVDADEMPPPCTEGGSLNVALDLVEIKHPGDVGAHESLDHTEECHQIWN